MYQLKAAVLGAKPPIRRRTPGCILQAALVRLGLTDPTTRSSRTLAREMLRIFNISFVSSDLGRLSQFWQVALGYKEIEASTDLVRLRAPAKSSPDLLLMRADSHLAAAGRLHLDLAAESVPREIERLLGLGATLVDGGSDRVPVLRTGKGLEWVVLRDPDGNEFCVGGLPGAP